MGSFPWGHRSCKVPAQVCHVAGSVIYHKIAFLWLMGNQWLFLVPLVTLQSQCSGTTFGVFVCRVWKKNYFEYALFLSQSSGLRHCSLLGSSTSFTQPLKVRKLNFLGSSTKLIWGFTPEMYLICRRTNFPVNFLFNIDRKKKGRI